MYDDIKQFLLENLVKFLPLSMKACLTVGRLVGVFNFSFATYQTLLLK
jgi:Na+/H+ antiporter NhaA